MKERKYKRKERGKLIERFKVDQREEEEEEEICLFV